LYPNKGFFMLASMLHILGRGIFVLRYCLFCNSQDFGESLRWTIPSVLNYSNLKLEALKRVDNKKWWHSIFASIMLTRIKSNSIV
jgi:hypothetical protein